jgi:hypothetical protein
MSKFIYMNNSYLKLVGQWPKELKKTAIDNRFPYIHEKARLFELLGKDKYRKIDFFNQPDISLSDEEIEIIHLGCQQVKQGKGLTAVQPFENLDVSGFHALMRLFHFKPISRVSKIVTVNQSRGVLDQITFKHLMDDSEVAYFNFCAYDLE